MMKFVLKNAHKSGTRFGVLFKPSTIGDPIAIDMAHTSSIVTNMRKLFLCFAYLIGCVTAIYLKWKIKILHTVIAMQVNGKIYHTYRYKCQRKRKHVVACSVPLHWKTLMIWYIVLQSRRSELNVKQQLYHAKLKCHASQIIFLVFRFSIYI